MDKFFDQTFLFKYIIYWLDTEILAHECLTKLPIRWCHVPWGGCPSVTAGDSKGKRLATQISIGLPILPPVTSHAQPVCFGPFDARPHNIPCTSHVGDQNQVEVTEAVDCESYPSSLPAWHPVNKQTYKINFTNCPLES